MWVGKFETGYKGATSTAVAQVNANDSTKVIIKPNVYSWRSINVKNIFETSYNYLRENDSHMMKNTEWGAVAYLSHSKYGIDSSIRINNNRSYITGYSKTEQPSCGWTNSDEKCNKSDSTVLNQNGEFTRMYNTSIGYLASTTRNISGIYDMSGGTHEYMASYMAGQSNNSGLSVTNYDSKYFDVYDSLSTSKSYNYRILGDAVGEMGPFTNLKSSGSDGEKISYVLSWYAATASFISSVNPWFCRGGAPRDGILASQFYFNGNSGSEFSHIGFRIVLAP